MKIETIIKLKNINLNIFGAPRLINIKNLDNNFIISYENISQKVISYFYNDPKKWELPAKNYFVRICLAKYINIKFPEIDFIGILNNDDILPYDDKFSLPYKKNKKLYDNILNNIYQIEKTSGYKKTIEIFGYLYEPNID